MSTRQAIRGFSVASFVLCAACWMWSYPFREHLSYNSPTSQRFVLEIGGGSVFLAVNWGHLTPPGWMYYHLGKDPSAGALDTVEGARLLGFHFFRSPAPPGGFGSFAQIPFWFLTAIAAGLAWFIWHKTRKPGVGRRFPVQASKPVANDSK
jgi:hypothetical protein